MKEATNEATVYIGDVQIVYTAGDDDVINVFGGDKGELVIMYEDKIKRIYNAPFVVENKRKQKDIEA